MKIGSLVKIRKDKIPPGLSRTGLVVKIKTKFDKKRGTSYHALVRWATGSTTYYPMMDLEVLSA